MSSKSHTSTTATSKKGWLSSAAMALGALGVVYGDIGTSPLYAIKEIFFGHAHLPLNDLNIMGVTSMVFWAVTIIVAFKYVAFVLRADNEGEGGVFALFGLLQKRPTQYTVGVSMLLLLAAGLLFGDGIITPAISVISAVEGLTVITAAFAPYVIPITIAILIALFSIQKHGTHVIGKFFGPIIALWFTAIGSLGAYYVWQHPAILGAINPVYALQFLIHNPLHTIFLVLGSVMLVVTGGEAMYADMGHFGRTPIRLSWFLAAYPALLLNYFGQGAFLMTHPHLETHNIFFSMVPSWGLLPMVLLATAATVIASQALITGAFSLTSQAISLGFLPYLKTIHTHHEHEGQIYVPAINWALLVGCIVLVLTFKTSSNLASAYGLAVACDMVITSLGMAGVARNHWRWSLWRVLLLFVPLALIDLVFLSANSLKFFEGGYLPILLGISVLIVMRTWQWGQLKLSSFFKNLQEMTMSELVALRKKADHVIPRSVLMISPYAVDKLSDKVPLSQQVYIDRKVMLPKNLILLHIQNDRTPHVAPKNRYKVNTFYSKANQGCVLGVTARIGFMESFDLDTMITDIAKLPEVHIDEDSSKWIIHELQVMILANKPVHGYSWYDGVRRSFFKIIYEATSRLDEFYDLDEHHLLSFEVLPTKLK
jgi:KUP system potassium uptake protein